MTKPLRVLMVCTANICRSPMAEWLLRAAAEERNLAMTVSSAGFLFDDQPASPMVVELMKDRGHDLSGHRSRKVTKEMVEEADLVLTMEYEQVQRISSLTPFDISDLRGSVTPRTVFAFVEFVEVLGYSKKNFGDLDAPARIAAADDNRPPAFYWLTKSVNVRDPHGQDVSKHLPVADLLTELAVAAVDGLGPAL